MKILLIYPEYPDTFWSFKHALGFGGWKAAFPPLGLLTIAALLPGGWKKRLIDMNVSSLKDKDIDWADYVFISAMIAQKTSTKQVIERCRERGVKVVAGGPLFTTGYKEFIGQVDHFVLGEAEAVLARLLTDISKRRVQSVYASKIRPDITFSPVPLWDLINLRHYAAMAIQYSRGCPYDCEFCDITVMNGRRPRTKTAEQIVRELTALRQKGWGGSVFFVDDNFIGHKPKVKEVLKEIISWQEKEGYPFVFLTETSLNLVDDDELIQLIVKAGFDKVFIGLETPDEKSLVECGKSQNIGRDMKADVNKLQRKGLQVYAGFIVGFDNDPLSIFDRLIRFIQQSGVVVAMVGLLEALPETKLWHRLEKEGRLEETSSGNNTDGALNFRPKMDAGALRQGYQRILQTIYSPGHYYKRLRVFLEEYKPARSRSKNLSWPRLRALISSILRLGVLGGRETRWYYWKTLLIALLKNRRAFPEAVTLAIYGFHFRKVLLGK